MDITDRISDMPNDILEHIIWSLSSRDVMRLSVLSRRWREVCSSLFCLNVDIHRDGWHLLNFQDDRSLKKFVKTMLCHYNTSNLHTFRFTCEDPKLRSHIPLIPLFSREPYMGKFTQSVLEEVAKFNPRIVYLDIRIINTKHFSSIFIWKSIEELCLRHQEIDGLLATPEVVTLPNLKKMHLIDASICSDSLNNVLSSCPLIEELSLQNCFMTGVFVISNTTLKRLSLERCSYGVLTICACNLVSLDFVKTSILHAEVRNLSSLVHARINYSYIVCSSPYDILGGLSAVQHLDLSAINLKVALDEVLTNLPKFGNMKSLSLNGWCMACDSLAVECFLKKSPNLEKLTVFLKMRNCLAKDYGNHGKSRQIKAPRCKGLEMLVVRVSKRYRKAYGSGMAFLRVVKQTKPAQVVLCN